MRRNYNRANSAVQKVQTFDRLLTSNTVESVGLISTFKVPVPDSRLRTKISLFWNLPPAQALGSLASTLWLYEADLDLSGNGGDLVPLTDLVGTQAAPLTIPQNVDLLGYSREFITAADYICGVLTMTVPPEGQSSWVLQCRYQPQSVRFTDDEWQEIAAACNPSVDVVSG
jgi:hypothetical protein